MLLSAVSAMAERLANHFACYRPASDLFLQLLELDKVEDAKFMLAVSHIVSIFDLFSNESFLDQYLLKMESKDLRV